MPLLQPIPGGIGNSTIPAISTTQYNYLCGLAGTWTTADNTREQNLPVDGSFRNLTVELTVAPGSGKSRTFKYYINGVATGTGVTISDTDTTGSSIEIVEVSAGDIITLECSNSGTPAATFARWGCSWVPATARPQAGIQVMGSSNSPHNTSTTYSPICPTNSSWTTSFNISRIVWPEDGTYDTLRVELVTAPGASKSRDFTVMLNGVATSLTTTISDTDTIGSDLANSVTLADTDDIMLRAIPTGTPASSAVRFSGAYESGTANNSVLPTTGGAAAMNTASPSYVSTWAGHVGWGTASATYLMLSGGDEVEFKRIRVECNAAPGAGKSYAIALATGATPSATALSVTIADTDSTGATDADVTVAAGTVVTVQSTPSGTPTGRSAHLSMVVNAFLDDVFNGGVMTVSRAWRRLRR